MRSILYFILVGVISLPSYAGSEEYQALLDTYHELYAINQQLQNTELVAGPKGASGDRGQKGETGNKGDKGHTFTTEELNDLYEILAISTREYNLIYEDAQVAQTTIDEIEKLHSAIESFIQTIEDQ